MDNQKSSCGCSIGLGGIVAIICSWSVNHSLIWAILHAFCGWLYVIYWIFVYGMKK